MSDNEIKKKPVLKTFKTPEDISEYPTGPSFESGHLVSKNAGWRTFRPLVDEEKCIGCFRCYLLCPDGTVSKKDNGKVEIDYDFCKGCGVCAHECPVSAITMIKERGE